ncbi:flagellin [Massilia timonae]|uniref:flagellin N-terminal helical domain-containing protein n=1 Tax=Massilia timonae TaxID=47229 RepID=UPI002356E2D7|nr:flagellin [Massilia timonae]
MLSLHTNNAALSAQNAISRNQSSLSTSMTRLSTGYRINSAMDDAAGLQIATRLKAQTSGMAMAMRNTQNGISMMQTAEGALGETSNILVRMKDLATQAADASSTSADKTAMQSEYDALARELTNIVGNTSFGGSKLLTQAATAGQKSTAAADLGAATTAATNAATATGNALTAYSNAQTAYGTTPTAANAATLATTKKAWEDATIAETAAVALRTSATAYNTAANASSTNGTFASAMNFQIGASTSETMSLDITASLASLHVTLGDTSTNYNSFGAAMGLQGTELTGTGASGMIDKLQAAIDSVGAVRSSLGAASNRLEHVSTNLSNISANTEAATGRIMDVDFATESANMTSNQMLLQAGTAMLKQSNSLSSMVMSLLQ